MIKIIDNVLSDLELEVLDIAIVPLKVGEEGGTHELVVEEAPTDKGLKACVHKAVEVDEEGEEIDEAHPSTPHLQSTIHKPFLFRSWSYFVFLCSSNIFLVIPLCSVLIGEINHSSNFGGHLYPQTIEFWNSSSLQGLETLSSNLKSFYDKG